MKISISKLITALFIALPLVFHGCKKDVVSTSSTLSRTTSDEISEADAPGIYETTSGDIKLVLQPANEIGQDAWIEYSPTNSDYATHNSGFIDQLKVWTWTDGGNFNKSKNTC